MVCRRVCAWSSPTRRWEAPCSPSTPSVRRGSSNAAHAMQPLRPLARDGWWDDRRGRWSRAQLEQRRGVSYGAAMARVPAVIWVLHCDGGARGNPGPGAAAYVLFDAGGVEVEARGEYLGSVTNNVAE